MVSEKFLLFYDNIYQYLSGEEMIIADFKSFIKCQNEKVFLLFLLKLIYRFGLIFPALESQSKNMRTWKKNLNFILAVLTWMQ